jgi:hypothetical protein
MIACAGLQRRGGEVPTPSWFEAREELAPHHEGYCEHDVDFCQPSSSGLTRGGCIWAAYLK